MPVPATIVKTWVPPAWKRSAVTTRRQEGSATASSETVSFPVAGRVISTGPILSLDGRGGSNVRPFTVTTKALGWSLTIVTVALGGTVVEVVDVDDVVGVVVVGAGAGAVVVVTGGRVVVVDGGGGGGAVVVVDPMAASTAAAAFGTVVERATVEGGVDVTGGRTVVEVLVEVAQGHRAAGPPGGGDHAAAVLVTAVHHAGRHDAQRHEDGCRPGQPAPGGRCLARSFGHRIPPNPASRPTLPRTVSAPQRPGLSDL